MKYLTIPPADITTAVHRLIGNPGADLADLERQVGKGAEIELPDLTAASTEMRAALATFTGGPSASDQDLFEGQQSPTIHELFRHQPLHVLDDAGFWAWVSLRHFWWLVCWRETAAFEKDPSKWLPYVDGRRTTECVVSRMYLRGQVCHAAGDPTLAYAVPAATDFWRSHITRVSTGTIPSVTAAFVRTQASDRMATDPLRQFAKRLNRLSTNVLLDVYEDGNAEELIQELHDK